MQVQQLQEQAKQCDEVIQERCRQAKELRGSDEQLKEVEQALVQLNDPRGQTKAQHETIRQEPTYQRQLQAEEQKLQATEQQLQALDQQLQVYADLDMRIGEHETILQQTSNGYNTYLKNEQTARLLPQRQQAYQEILSATQQAQQALQVAEQAYQTANEDVHEEEMNTVQA